MNESWNSKTFLETLDIWTLAVNLGAVESIVTQPTGMTHATNPENERPRFGITEHLIPLSVEIEGTMGLIQDL